MKMLLLNPKKGFSVVDAEGLDDYYRHLECDMIDIVAATVNGQPVEIICDDEGLLKPDPIPSAFFMEEGDDEYERLLVGNLLFSGPANEEGELSQISRGMAMYLLTRVKTRLYYDEDEGYELIYHVVLDK